MSRPPHNLPKPPTLSSLLGPSFILLGLALGSGELIMWPYLTSQYGLGLLWGGLLGISLQFVLNTEIMRYTLARGESVFVGFRKLHPLLPLWFIISTFIPWSLPGFSSAASSLLHHLWPSLPLTYLAIFFLLFTGIVLSLGRMLYTTMEKLQKTIILLGLPFLLFLSFRLTHRHDWLELTWGLFGKGDGWWFFPPGIAIGSFLGAFAYSGAGGNLNLAQSYYIKEKGFGMGKFTGKITSLFSSSSPKKLTLTGFHLTDTPTNRSRWSRWWRLVNIEHFLAFWLLGLITIFILAVLAKSLLYGYNVGQGIQFLFHEQQVITTHLNNHILGIIFILIAALMLFSTQVGILESSSRIISENIFLLFNHASQVNLSLGFYIALWGQIGLGIIIILLGFQEPRFLLTLGAILNALAMMVSCLLLIPLNTNYLPTFAHPHPLRKTLLFLGALFFLILFSITLFSQQI